MGLLGGAMAAGGMALAVYLSGGSAIESVAAQDVVYFRIGGGAPGSTAYGMAGQLAGTVSNPPGSRQCDGEGACGVEGLLGLAQTTLNPVDSLESLRRGSLEAAIISGDGSIPTTAPEVRSRRIAAMWPVPQPTSRTSSVPRSSSIPTSRSPAALCTMAWRS